MSADEAKALKIAIAAMREKNRERKLEAKTIANLVRNTIFQFSCFSLL
jgi:hypothetical protein